MNNKRIETLLRNAIEGCEDSTTEFVREFEAQIRLEIRARMAKAGVRLKLDSIDIAQSVFFDFLTASRTGSEAQLSPQEALARLIRTSREEVQRQIRFHTAGKRDVRRETGIADEHRQLPSDVPQPTENVQEGDLREFLRSRIGNEDFRLVEMRMQGWSWPDIAEAIGMSADACRMRLHRLKMHWPQELADLLPQPRD
ncbi:ECF-type sigma factor [Roseiconus lacunae]|uniref:ECF-type sigma factor n=1 Tax=Roseiconus lacunae TaxID=2605694 RepID=A0ABT7PSK7_9BACT|nr:ECF-type sigma factor [Roseiconus lacunae]MDM4019264.1 ECF-type sigma factor [Roseiconus lacunae]WRQ51921.1 ECF-type sigma factor [Stieleria sp. HD01]